MPRYECFEGASEKFWTIERTERGFTVTFGKIGAAGRTDEKTFDSEERAQQAYEKLVAEKLKRGYALAGAPPAAKPVAADGRPEGVPASAIWIEKDKEWELATTNAEGQRHGITEWWRADGTLCCRTEYVRGQAQGTCTRFHENGEVSLVGTMKAGRLEGTVIYTRSTGKTTEHFTHGNFGAKVWRVEREFHDSYPTTIFRAFDREGRACDIKGHPLDDDADKRGVVTEAHFAAPPRSEAAQVWTTDARPSLPTELVQGVWMTPEFRRVLVPRRGGVATMVRPIPSLEEAWAALRRAAWDSARVLVEKAKTEGKEVYLQLWAFVTSDYAFVRALGARLLDPAPHVGTFDEDVTMASRFMMRYSPLAAVHHGLALERLADFLMASVGIEEAISRLFAGMDDELPHADLGPFERIRDVLSVCDDATFERAKAAVLMASKRELEKTRAQDYVSSDRIADLRWAASFLLPVGPGAPEEARGLLEEAMKSCRQFGSGEVHAAGLAAGDLATLKTYRAANDKTRHEFFYPVSRMYLAALMEHVGASITSDLIQMKPAYPFADSNEQNSRWAFLLAHLDDDAALERLLAEHRADAKYVWGASGLASAWRCQASRVARVLEAAGEVELLARIESGAIPPLQLPTNDFDAGAPKGEPFAYTPPSAERPKTFTSRVNVEPAVAWRSEERDLALEHNATPETWDTKPVGTLDPAELEVWIAHRERWKIPTTIAVLAAAPVALYPRLSALGFQISDYDARWALGAVALKGGVLAVPVLNVVASRTATVEHGITWSLPIGDAALAPPIFMAFAGKKNKALARSWLLRHPRHAIAGALSVLLAPDTESDKETKSAATRALRYLDGKSHREAILGLAREANVEPMVCEILAADPFTLPKAKLPKLPPFVDPKKLPALVGKSGADVPRDRVDRLLLELAASNVDEVHPGVLAIRETTKPGSRAAFAWALFEAWLAAGADAKQIWAMQALGVFGDDESVRKLVALAKEWPGAGASARAQSALEVLANVGSDLALMNINLLAEKSKFPAFKAAAAQCIAMVADARGLTSDELSDRLAPTLGLDDPENATLTFGDRVFTIAFDENLRPVLREQSGAVSTTFPKAKKGEDATQAKAGAAKLAALAKDAKVSASLHLARLERAMQTGRVIAHDLFFSCFAHHPWMSHLARRLVWRTDPGGASFRVAEDGSLATADDNTFELPKGTSVKIAHPLELGPVEIKTWSERFAEYEILQPFLQLSRPTFTPTEEERGASTLSRVSGKAVPHGALQGLRARGWELSIDSWIQSTTKTVTPGVYAILDFSPGWAPGDGGDERPPQTLEAVRLVTTRGTDVATFGMMPAVAFSELVHDLEGLTAPG